MKYTEKEINDLLSIKPSWSLEKKQKSIKRSFRKYNGQTNTATTQKQLDNAEKMLEVCAQAIQIYKEPAHKRNYTKKKPAIKYTPKKTTSNKNDGCLIPIVISLSSFGLLIWIIIYGLF